MRPGDQVEDDIPVFSLSLLVVSISVPGSGSQGPELQLHEGWLSCGGPGLSPGLGSYLLRQVCDRAGRTCTRSLVGGLQLTSL